MLQKLKNITIYLLLVLIGILIIALIVFSTQQTKRVHLSQVKIAGTLLQTSKPLRHFELSDDKNRVFTNKNLLGHWTIWFFGFTRCQSICPTTMADLNQFYQQLKLVVPSQSLPQVILASIDPAYDSEQRLHRYVRSFNINFLGVRGSKHELQSLAKQMGIHFQKVSSHSSNEIMSHSARLLLINPKGKLQAYFKVPFEPKQLASDYKKIVSVTKKTQND